MISTRPLIAINLCSIRPNQLSGPSVYAERLTAELLVDSTYRWLIFCHGKYSIPPVWERRADIRRVISTVRRPVRVAFEQLVLPVLARREQVDLLFSPNFVSPLWGPRYRVVTIHDMYYRVTPHIVPRWQRTYWQLFIGPSAKGCDRVLAVSGFTAKDIQRLIPEVSDRVRVTPLASAVEDPDVAGEPVVNQAPGFVLWVANVVGNKNPEAVCRAAALLRTQHPDLEFVHVGTDEHGLFDAGLSEHGVADRVRRLGRVASSNLRWLYRNALCVIQPSLYEGFGIPVLEAQHFGVPLICSDAGPLPEIAGDGALYFPAEKPERLASAIARLRYDVRLRSELADRGQRNARRYSWSRTADLTLQVFAELLGPTTPVRSGSH